MAWGVEEQEWRKGPWTPQEDKLLIECVNLHGEGRWSSVARSAGLSRSGKSCRLRWVNYLRPGLKKGPITQEEEGIIIQLHALMGNKWSAIARYLPGRTDNEIKNYWRTHFKKKEKSSQKQEKRKAQILKLKQAQQQLQAHDPIQDRKRVVSYTSATISRVNGKRTEVAPQEKQDMMFMYPTSEDQCLPVMMANHVANQMDDNFLWKLEDNYTISNKINALQNQGASNYSFGIDSGTIWSGGGYIF